MTDRLDRDGKVRITGFFKDAGAADPEMAYRKICALYGMEGRAYHTMAHIVEGLDKMPGFAHLIENKEAFMLAWLFHDAIYNTVTPARNEEDSAEIMELYAQDWGFNADTIEKAKKHILATTHRIKNLQGDTPYLVDLDMSIIGSPRSRYKIYAADIRLEYAQFTPEEWSKRRSEYFLTPTLVKSQNNQLFNTPYFAERYNRQAILNLKWELRSLQLGAPTRPPNKRPLEQHNHS